MRRGFLLSLDALFALSLVLLGLSFFALRPSGVGLAGSSLFLGGRDYLASGGALEADLLRRGWQVTEQPRGNSALSVHVLAPVYPRVCGLSTAPSAACLSRPDETLVAPSSGVWVGSG